LRPRQRGFSLLELVVAIVLIGVLLGVAIERLLVMKGQAESRAMDEVIGNLRSAMTIRMAELIAKGRAEAITDLIGSNPMALLAQRPDYYLGELFGPDPAVLAPGSWYFDTRQGTLCYLVDSFEYFESALRPPRACFSIQPSYDDANGNGRFDREVDILRGLRLAPLAAYHWRLRTTWSDWPFGVR
jgi:prepilin-type N-terminal cleavage/methylation domain-containing protein